MLLIHEGGQQNVPVTTPPTPVDPSGCANFTGALPPIVAGLDPEFDLVVSGHTHRPYVCELPNSAGTKILATSAGTAGIARHRHHGHAEQVQDDFTSLRPGTSSSRTASGTRRHLADDGSGVFVRNPASSTRRPRPCSTSTAPRSRRSPTASSGRSRADITRTHADASQESALGDVIADAQLAYTASGRGADRLHEPRRHPSRPDLRELAGRRGAGPGDLRRGLHRPAVQQPGHHADLHRRPDQGRPRAAVPGSRAATPLDPPGLRGLHLHLQHERSRRVPASATWR